MDPDKRKGVQENPDALKTQLLFSSELVAKA